jgi:hypothetical protein
MNLLRNVCVFDSVDKLLIVYSRTTQRLIYITMSFRKDQILLKKLGKYNVNALNQRCYNGLNVWCPAEIPPSILKKPAQKK